MLRVFQAERLRETNPVTLEIVLQEGLRHPIGAIAPATLVDMVALGEAEGVPKALLQQLQTFTTRVANEVASLPDGAIFDKFLADLGALPPQLVSARLREIVGREAHRDARPAIAKAKVAELVRSWADTEPALVRIAGAAPRIQHAVAVTTAEEPAAARRARALGAPKEPKAKAPRAAAAPRQRVVLTDPIRDRLITDTVFERLGANGSSGLAANVLAAGVLHRVRAQDPEATPQEIQRVLNDLKNQGRLKLSAGRWFMLSRW